MSTKQVSKVCVRCRVIKPFCDFNIRRASKDGYSYLCKDCNRVSSQDYRKANKDKLKEYERLRWIKNKSNYEYLNNKKQYLAQYAREHKSAKSVYDKLRRIANKEDYEKYTKKYYSDNREKIMAKVRVYNEQKKNSLSDVFLRRWITASLGIRKHLISDDLIMLERYKHQIKRRFNI